MKKTLMMTLEFPPMVGGVAASVDRLARSLDAAAVTVLAPMHPQADASDAASGALRVVRRMLFFPRWIWPRWLKLFFTAAGIVRRGGIERVTVHHALPVGYIALLFKWFCGIPYVVFYYGTDVYSAIASPWKRKMLRLVAARATMNVFGSHSLATTFASVFPHLSKRTAVIPPCPDPYFFEAPTIEAVAAAKERYTLAGKTVLLSVGRMVEGKGFMRIAQLLPSLLERVPNLVWLVVGDGPKRASVAEEVKKVGLTHMVRFAGEIPHEDLPAVYALADLFLLLTHPNDGAEEGFGLVFLEAGAMGKAVVAGKGGGVEEAVLHGKTGLVVNAFHKDEVVEACVQLLTDHTETARLGNNACERVRAEFRFENYVDRVNTWLS